MRFTLPSQRTNLTSSGQLIRVYTRFEFNVSKCYSVVITLLTLQNLYPSLWEWSPKDNQPGKDAVNPTNYSQLIVKYIHEEPSFKQANWGQLHTPVKRNFLCGTTTDALCEAVCNCWLLAEQTWLTGWDNSNAHLPGERLRYKQWVLCWICTSGELQWERNLSLFFSRLTG